MKEQTWILLVVFQKLTSGILSRWSVGQSCDDVTETGQRLVDGSSLFETVPSGSCTVCPLAEEMIILMNIMVQVLKNLLKVCRKRSICGLVDLLLSRFKTFCLLTTAFHNISEMNYEQTCRKSNSCFPVYLSLITIENSLAQLSQLRWTNMIQ